MFSIPRKSISKWVPIVLGLLLGITTALLWYFGIITFVKAALPFAFAAALLMFIVTAVLKARCGSNEWEGCCINPTCASVRKFSPMIMISAAVFIPFNLAVYATNLSLAMKIVLAFIGGISFWTLLLAFVSAILSIYYTNKA